MENEVDSEAKGLALADVPHPTDGSEIVEITGKHDRNGHQNATRPSKLTHFQLRQPKHLKLFEGWMLKLNIETSKPFKGKDRFFIGTMAQQKVLRRQSMISMLHD